VSPARTIWPHAMPALTVTGEGPERAVSANDAAVVRSSGGAKSLRRCEPLFAPPWARDRCGMISPLKCESALGKSADVLVLL